MNKSLLDLTTEVLANVTAQLESGTGVINLWKCGSMLLNLKLQCGGVTTFTLRDKYIAPHVVCIPTIITRLQGLRRLKINVQHVQPKPDTLALLLLLPTTLEHLRLVFGSVDSILHNLLTRYNALVYLQIEEPAIRLKDGSEHPPTLSLLKDDMIKLLPPYLHTLKLSKIDIANRGASWPLLRTHISKSQFLQRIRLHRQDLMCFTRDNSVTDVLDIPLSCAVLDFPPNLQKFNLLLPYSTRCINTTQRFEFRRSCTMAIGMEACEMHVLPNTIDELDLSMSFNVRIRNTTLTLYHHLHLQSLKLYLYNRSFNMLRDIWSFLPRTLKLLYIGSQQSPKYDYSNLFNIEELQALIPPDLEIFGTNLPLPLCIPLCLDGRCLPPKFWPSSITELTLPTWPIGAGNIPTSSYALPTTLRVLDTSRSPVSVVNIAEADVAHINVSLDYSQFVHLTLLAVEVWTSPVRLMPMIFPDSLQHLKIKFLGLTAELNIFTTPTFCAFTTSLPPQLSSLDILYETGLVPIQFYRQWFLSLPRTLTSLTTNICLDSGATSIDGFSRALTCLPPQLKSLNMAISWASLAVLHNIIERMHMIKLSMLPRNLETLNVDAHYFSLASLDVVMPHLRHLSIWRVSNLPYPVTHFPKLEFVRLINSHATNYYPELLAVDRGDLSADTFVLTLRNSKFNVL